MAEKAQFEIIQTTINLFSSITFEEYYRKLSADADQITPDDILNSLLESIRGKPPKEAHLLLRKKIYPEFEHDSPRGIIPDILIITPNIIKGIEERISNNGKEIYQIKGFPNLDGWTVEEIEKSKELSKEVEKLRSKIYQLRLIRNNLLSSLMDSPSFEVYKSTLEPRGESDLVIVKNLVEALLKKTRKERYAEALKMMSCISEDESKNIFPEFMARRLTYLTLIVELAQQELGTKDCKPQDDNGSQTTKQQVINDSSMFMTSTRNGDQDIVREHPSYRRTNWLAAP